MCLSGKSVRDDLDFALSTPPNPGKGQPMTKKIERVFREHRLSAEEVARDQEVRRKVQAEFPAATPSSGATGRLSQARRDALRASNKSMYQIAQDAGVSQIVLSRFLSGERDIRMATADKLAEALGLKLASAS
jgi:MoCo/4Fe-4S cofactor protein with predicted Tat translocation signal